MRLFNYLLSLLGTMLLSINVFASPAQDIETAIFAGGCFWSMQHDFDKVPGVIHTEVGYTGGHLPNPSYEQVSSGKTGHLESIKITYDPHKVSYADLLNFYWHDIDPTDADGQFCDKGNEYHSVIFYLNDKQKAKAEASKKELEKSSHFKQIATMIKPASTFYPAEEYHQKYAVKNPEAYTAYRSGCGRDAKTQELWGK